MRTTVTLDDDLAIRIERLRHEQGRTFKTVINEVVRAGLEALSRPAEPPASDGGYTVPVDLGEPYYGDLPPAQVPAILDEADDTGKLSRATR